MTYFMGDPHGRYEWFLEMLQRIRFSDSDTLYILGDIADRGPQVAELYLDIMSRKNVFTVKGNHELMAEKMLGFFMEQYADAKGIPETDLAIWLENGGGTTLKSIAKQKEEDRRAILDYIRRLPAYLVAEVKGRRFVLVHGGPVAQQITVEDLDKMGTHRLAWNRPDFNGTYFKDKNTILVVGHTPTFNIYEPEGKAKIYYGDGDVIVVDCGAAAPEYGGQLACLCVETGEEFYVS